MGKLLKSLFFMLLLCLSTISWGEVTRLPPTQRPVMVKVGLFINNFVDFDQTNEAIQFVGTLSERWMDKRLAFKPINGVHVKTYFAYSVRGILAKIWHPELVMMKPKGPLQIESRYVSIQANGQVTYLRRFLATTQLHLKLHKYPFDTQTLEFGVMPLYNTVDKVQLQQFKDRQGLASFANLVSWNKISTKIGIKVIDSPMIRQPVSHYYIKVTYRREVSFYVFQLMVPLVLIVFFSFSVFWMLKNPLVNRVAISLTALLTIVVFQWRVFNQIPRVNYHIFLDSFMLYSFVVAGVTLVASIVLENIHQRKSAYVLGCRVLFPVAYIVGSLIIVLAYFA